MNRERVGGVRFLTQKQEITDADYVYAPTSERRYQELVELFLIKLKRVEDAQKSPSGSDDAMRKDA